MSIQNVVFHIPAKIKAGLESGIYTREGGVIRDVSNGQLVAFLRESSNKVDQAIPKLNQINSMANIINIGISTVGFITVISKLNALDSKIDHVISELSKANFNIELGFRSKLKSAFKNLSRISLIQDQNIKRDLLTQTSKTFSESYEIFKEKFEHDENIFTASELLYLSTFSGLGEVFVFLELEEIDAAIHVLDELNDYCKQAEEIYKNKYEKQKKSLDSSKDKRKRRFLGVRAMAGAGALAGAALPFLGLAFPLVGGGMLAMKAASSRSSNQPKQSKTKKGLPEKLRALENIFQIDHLEIRKIQILNSSLYSEIKYISENSISWKQWKGLAPKDVNENAKYMTIQVM